MTSVFAIAYVSSSGEGGIKLPHRRDAGEVVENLTPEANPLMAGNFLKYGGP